MLFPASGCYPNRCRAIGKKRASSESWSKAAWWDSLLSTESSSSVLLAAGHDWAVIVHVSPCTGFWGASDPNLLELNKAVPRLGSLAGYQTLKMVPVATSFTSLKSSKSGEKCSPRALLERKKSMAEKPKKYWRNRDGLLLKTSRDKPAEYTLA